MRVGSVYHERVMDRSHVLRLGSHMIDVFHRCRVVKYTDLQGHKNTVIIRTKGVCAMINTKYNTRQMTESDGAERGTKRLQTDLHIELIAGVASVEFRAGESEPSLDQGGRLPAPVAHLSQGLFVVSHRVHALPHKAETHYTKVHRAVCASLKYYNTGLIFITIY